MFYLHTFLKILGFKVFKRFIQLSEETLLSSYNLVPTLLIITVTVLYLQGQNQSTFSQAHQHVSQDMETLRAHTHLPLYKHTHTHTRSDVQQILKYNDNN